MVTERWSLITRHWALENESPRGSEHEPRVGEPRKIAIAAKIIYFRCMDARTLRLYQLQKQNLSVKAPRQSFRRLLKENLGLHSTDYLTPYLSLWARVEGFAPRSLYDDLNRSRAAVRVRAFRGTVFVVHRDNLGLILRGLRPYHSSIQAAIGKMGRKSGQDFQEMERRVRTLLRGKKLLPAAAINIELRTSSKRDVLPFFLRSLEFGGVLVRVGQAHAEDRNLAYGLLEEWFPEVVLDKSDPQVAPEALSLAYIRKFGPVCLDDLSWWMPAPKSTARSILNGLGDRLASFELNGRDYYLAREELGCLHRTAPEKGEPAVHLLPYEDHYPKAYARRDWFMSPETERLLISTRTIELGQIRPSIWLDGEAIGRWEIERLAAGGGGAARLAAKVKIAGFVKSAHRSKSFLDVVEERRLELERFLNERLLPLCGTQEGKDDH